MNNTGHYKIISIERPLYFLCGPDINKSQKRNVLSSFLKKKFENQTIRPFPIIVDRIFEPTIITRYKLDLVLLEEIVAATSLKTYIFLDSLSTAYELGLFKNSRSKNSVRLLVEETYAQRERRTIGEYILKSIGQSNLLNYLAENFGEAELEFFEFKDGKVSKNIEDCIDQEMMDYSKNVQSINLTIGENDGDPNNVFIKMNGHNLKVTFSLKSLFYMMQFYVYSKISSYKQIKALNDKEFKTLIRGFKLFIKRQILLKLGSKLDKVTLFDKYDITVNQFEKDKTEDIIKHVYYFFVLLTENSGSLHKLTSTKDAFHDVRKRASRIEFNILDAFAHADSKIRKTIHSYLANPDMYVDSISYVINKKLRKIYKYKDSYKGQQLRFAHERITSMLDLILPSNPLSFAYKTGQNTLKCFSEHKESCNFLKLDIHHYFESIKYRRFIVIFLKQITDNLKANGIKEAEFFGIDEFKMYIKALFYKGHIPLGFVSSPKVSDFYLKSLDDWAQKRKDVRYSRYADDVLFSSSDLSFSFSYIKKAFERRINEKGLSINPDKVINKKLIKQGDCIKFLGICLVKSDNENEIRISKHYLKEVIKGCYKAEKNGTLEDEHILGKIRYIKLISSTSYEKLLEALSTNEKGLRIISVFKSLSL